MRPVALETVGEDVYIEFEIEEVDRLCERIKAGGEVWAFHRRNCEHTQ